MIKNFIISALILLGVWHFKLPLIDVGSDTNAVGVISTLVQISAIMIGFVITAYSILISISDKPIIKNMHETGHFKYLLRRLLNSSLFFGLALVAGLFILFIKSAPQYVFMFLFATTVIAIVILVDAARLFLKLIHNLND